MNCKNCDHPLSDTDNFCLSCGAKVIRNRLTLRNLFADFSEQFLNYDNKFLQTFITLFKKPEDVIGSYISGTRKKYVNVVSYFAIAITYAGFFTYLNQKYFPQAYSEMFARMNQDPNQAEFSANFMQIFIEYQTLIFFILVPVLALMTRLVFLKNKKYNYTELFVINIYAYSQMSFVVTTLSLFAQFDSQIFYLNSLIALPLQILYFAFVLKRLFALSFQQILLKTLLFLVILIVFYIIFVVLTLIYMFAFTDFFEKIIEAEKAKQKVSYIISSAINWTS
jgi:hypothetical protein